MNAVYDNLDSKTPNLTGYFRDGQRRIDLVLVCKTSEADVEECKMNFLSNAINAGLHLEIESGTAAETKELQFIKVHGPDHLVVHFGHFFNVRKYFKKNHVDEFSSCIRGERDYIKLSRLNQPGPFNYTTWERSVIVYRILRSVPFGRPENFTGLDRLLETGAILAAYPLHDGPWFMFPEQSYVDVNNRQSLFYNWVGYRNLLKFQPLHLIREYFGERIGFLFALMEYLNIFLFFAGLPGLAIYIHNRYSWKSVYERYHEKSPNFYKYTVQSMVPGSNKTEVGYDDLPVCPKCEDFVACPIRNLSEYNDEKRVKAYLDHPYNGLYHLFLVVMSVLFVLFWKRKEYKLNWLWEVRAADLFYYPKKARAEITHTVKSLTKRGSIPARIERMLFGSILHRRFLLVYPYMDTFVKKGFERVLWGLMLELFIVCYVPLMIHIYNVMLNRLRYFSEHYGQYDATQNYALLSILAGIHALFVVLFELLWYQYGVILTKFSNPYTEYEYEKTHVICLFMFCSIINYGVVLFFATIKGLFYTFPVDLERYYMPLKFGFLNCGILTCIDEAYVFAVVSYKMKCCLKSVLRWLNKSKIDQPYVTYECFTNRPVVENVPVWEREYLLKHTGEDYIMEKFNYIFLTFVWATVFTTLFPLAPLIIFVLNVFEIRHWATDLVIHRRRPLYLQIWGLGGWRNVLNLLPFIVSVFGSLVYVRTSTYLMRRHFYRFFKKMRFLADYQMSFFHTEDYKISSFLYSIMYPDDRNIGQDYVNYKKTWNDSYHPKFCIYPGPYSIQLKHYDPNRRQYLPHTNKWYINWHQALFVLFSFLSAVFFTLLFSQMCSSRPKKIRDKIRLEDWMKHYEIEKELASRVKPSKMPKKEIFGDNLNLFSDRLPTHDRFDDNFDPDEPERIPRRRRSVGRGGSERGGGEGVR